MYRPFILSGVRFANPHLLNDATAHEANENEVRQVLNNFIKDDGVIDGDKLSADWFPQIEADVFISHSHKDEKLAIQLSNYLKGEYGLNAFIDSSVWGYSDDLLRLFDNRYCYSEERKVYDYSLRNGSTAHVHMMLATALSKMMDRTECVFFLNTPNSISNSDVTDGGGNTSSAWIYYEMSVIRTLRPHAKPRLAHFSNRQKMAVANESLSVSYHVNFKGIPVIGNDEFNKWQGLRSGKGLSALDGLYSMIPEGDLYE